MLTELSALLDLLRSKGVTKYFGAMDDDPKSLRVEIELALADAPAKSDEKDDSPITDIETCRCGHALFTHTNGLCGEGCDVERCAPPVKP